MSQILVALDLETTGLRPETDEIIEIAAVKFQGDKVLGQWETLVRPRSPLPFRTEQFTGISAKEAAAAPPLSAVAGQLVSFIRNCPIVGQSIPQDMSFLAHKGIALSNRVYDTFDLASILLPELSNYSLAALADHFGISFPVKHRAMPDAWMAMRVFNALWKRASEIDLAIIGEINRLTANTPWPLRDIFEDIEKTKSRSVFENSIGAQLAGKKGLEETNLEFLLGKSRREEPLRPKTEKIPLERSSVLALLEEDSPLRGVVDEFEYRQEQVAMTDVVCRALNTDQQLLVEAGTGTGKSLAYLLPSACFALQNDAHVVVSTNTINLQDQLIGKDIPSVERLLNAENLDPVERERLADLPWGKKLRVSLVKGRSNYLCLRRWSHLRRSEGLSLDEVKVLIRLLVWLPSTTTGDRAELNLMQGETSVWSRVCAQSDSCMGMKCSFQRRGTCFLYRARHAAESSHIIVVNHALLLSDIASGSGVLPEFNYLIIDEAHHLEEEATSQWGFEAEEKRVNDYLDELSEPVAGGQRWLGLLSELKGHFRGSSVPPARQKEIDKLGEAAHDAVAAARPRSREFFDVLLRFVQRRSDDNGEYDRRLRLTRKVLLQPDWKDTEIARENLEAALSEVERTMSRLETTLEGLAGAKILEYEDLMLRISSLQIKNNEIRRQIGVVIGGDSESVVCWLSVNGRTGGVHLAAAPLNVGEMLHRTIYSEKNGVVLTSATMSVAGSFDYMRSRLGLERCKELIVGSPFNYKKAARMVVPNDLPEPNRPGHQRGVEQAIIDICRSSGGRALVLFTSHSAVRATYAAVRSPLEKEQVLVLGHEIDGSRKQLLTTFRTNPRTVLLGTSSFWEGIDVVGEALSVLVIVKLPFSVPTDPVFAARSETFDDPFNEYAVPQAILRFKQGFGRLIRSKRDRGVVVVLDRRVLTKGYGSLFLQSLPPAPLTAVSTRELGNEVASWLTSAQTLEQTAEEEDLVD